MNLTDAPHIFLQLFQWAGRSDFLDACSRRYGDIFTVQFPGSKPVTSVALEHVLTVLQELYLWRRR